MGTRDPQVDAYIARAAPFAQPILAHLRDTVHAACPDVVEAIKWSMPFFVLRGPLCHMAAFKTHCALGMWRAKDVPALAASAGRGGMGVLGRIASLADLPSQDELATLIREAAAYDVAGVRPAREPTAPKTVLEVPDDLARVLAGSTEATKRFAAFTPSARRDYIEWIVEAKRPATRSTRLATALEWIADGKMRHWKYQK